MKKEDVETAKQMFRSGKSVDFIIEQFQEYDPFVVLHDMSSLRTEFPNFQEERKAYVGKYIIKYADKNGWNTYEKVSTNLGFAISTVKEYMRLAERYKYAKSPPWAKRRRGRPSGAKDSAREYSKDEEEQIWNDYSGYHDGIWIEKNVMTAKQVCAKYGLTIGQFRGILRKVGKRKIEEAKKKKEGKSNGEEND